MRHRDLFKIKNPLPLIPTRLLAAAAQDKRNRRPVSQTRAGRIKCSGKDSAAKIAHIRFVNVARANAGR